MARLFNGSSEYLVQGSACGITDYPFTMATWFKADSAHDGMAMSLNDVSAVSYHVLYIRDPADTDVLALSNFQNTQGFAATSASYTAATWQHGCAVFTNDTSRTAYVNGGNSGSDVTDVDFDPLIDNMTLGRGRPSGGWIYFTGGLAESAIWNVALSAAEVAQLALGYCPLMIRPDALVAYWPLGGLYGVNSGNAANGDLDLVGGYHMDPQDTPSVADHPTTLIYPSGGVVVPSVAAAAVGNPWYYYANQKVVA